MPPGSSKEVFILPAKWTKKILSAGANSGFPQIGFEFLKDIGVMAVFVSCAGTGAESAGSLQPLFGLLDKRTTRVAVGLSGALIGTILKSFHYAFPALPLLHKSSILEWMDRETQSWESGTYEALSSGALTFMFVNGLLQKIMGPTVATTLSLISGCALGAEVILFHGENVGITPAQLKKLNQKVINKTPSTSSSLPHTMIKHLWHSVKIGIQGGLAANLLKLCCNMANISKSPWFYLSTATACLTAGGSNFLIQQHYLTERKANNVDLSLSPTKKRKILNKVHKNWLREVAIHAAPIEFFQYSFRGWLGFIYLYMATRNVIDYADGKDINGYRAVTEVSNWLLLLFAILSAGISSLLVISHILRYSDAIHESKEIQTKLRQEENDKKLREGVAPRKRNVIDKIISNISSVVSTLPLLNLLVATDEKMDCRQTIDIEIGDDDSDTSESISSSYGGFRRLFDGSGDGECMELHDLSSQDDVGLDSEDKPLYPKSASDNTASDSLGCIPTEPSSSSDSSPEKVVHVAGERVELHEALFAEPYNANPLMAPLLDYGVLTRTNASPQFNGTYVAPNDMGVPDSSIDSIFHQQ